jgi:hypothetical protein
MEKYMRERVTIVGGGIGGLTAAHELAERGFEVHLYERRGFLGGKAASVRTPKGQKLLPTEHGFRFYPAWYRHLPDTMKRIPFRGRRDFASATVYDNLVAVEKDLLAWYDRDPISVLMHFPRSAEQAKTLAGFAGDLGRLRLAPGEMAFFGHCMAKFAVMPEAERIARLEPVTWWDYLDADNKSQTYRDLIAATTRLMVAAKAQEASAYTIGKLALRTFSDALASVDRVLKGPTNEVWIDPWVEHLRGLGVTFHAGWELDSIELAHGEKRIESVTFNRVILQNVRRLARLVSSILWAIDSLLDPGKVELQGRKKRDAARAQLSADSASAAGLAEAIATDDNMRWCDEAADGQLSSCLTAVGVVAQCSNVLVEADDRLRAMIDDVTLGWESLHQGPPHEQVAIAEEALAALIAAESLRTLVENAIAARGGSHDGAIVDRARALCEDIVKRALVVADAARRAREAWGVAPTRPSCRAPCPLAKYAEAAAAYTARSETFCARIAELASPLGSILTLVGGSPLLDKESSSGGYFIFALPLEQMAYYVNRSTMLTYHDPSLRRIVLLSEYTDWMAGIQFFLKEPFNLIAGHIVCMDSEWSLTAIEETQFWRDVDLPSDVKGVLSVDIAAWDRKGRFVQKEAFNCTNEEIAHEVWNELKAAVNRKAKSDRLRDDMLLGSAKLDQDVNFHLDDSIVVLNDRKKQAAYEKARSVRFSAERLTMRQRESGHETETPYIWGGRLRFNVEPILVNRVGSRALRPEARTAIPNMFLAADYVRTETDLACMEGANEAARHAVNGILESVGSLEKRCDVWGFSTSRDVAERLASLTPFGSAATGMAKAAGMVTEGLLLIANRAMSGFGKGRSGHV